MTAGELHTLATRATHLLLKRHAAYLCGNEKLKVRFSEYRGARRVECAIEDTRGGTRMDFFIDVPGQEDDEAAIYLGLDFLDGVLAEHFESGREALPKLDPAPYEFEGVVLYLSGQIVRPALEAQADSILAAAGFFEQSPDSDEEDDEDEEERSEPLPIEGEHLGDHGGCLEEGGNDL
jgi:hypothetical protein